MKWLELSVSSPPEFVEPLSAIFHRHGSGGVAIEGGGGFNPDEGETAPNSAWVTLRTYVPLDSSAREKRSLIDVAVRLVAHLCPISPLRERVVDQDEWQDAWKQHFHVLRIGGRIVVVPTWRSYRHRASDVVIRLDPGMAFGTGHHPTTRMCLEQLERLVKPEMKVLDVGCGSGILSIAAAKLGARSVVGLDVDCVAADVARANARENHVEARVQVYQGTLPHSEVPSATFDVAMANISARVVSELAGHIAAAVKPGGKIVASGVVRKDRQSVVRELLSAGPRVEDTLNDGEWVTLVASVAKP